MILYLKHSKDLGETAGMWGKDTQIAKRTTTALDAKDQEYLEQPTEPYSNLYLRLVEPVCYLYSSRDAPPLVRFYAQECLATMCLKCAFLDRNLVLEAIFECLVGNDYQASTHNSFCDRLELK